MNRLKAVMGAMLVIATVGAVPEFGHASALVATGHVTYGSFASNVIAEEAAYVAGGCAANVPSGSFQAMIDIRKYSGRTMVLTATKTGTHLTSDTSPTAVHMVIKSDCLPAAGILGSFNALTGRPARFQARGYYLVLTNGDAALKHLDEYYKLEVL